MVTPLLGWRDVTDARASARSVIFCALPRYGAGNSVSLALPNISPRLICCLLANLASMVLDYVARFKIGGLHLNFFILEQLPVLPPTTYDTDSRIAAIADRVLELVYTSSDMRAFALDSGYEGPPFLWDGERRAHIRAELDAIYAHLYGLTRDELRYILDPTDVYGPDFPSETFRVLKEREIREHGEYRTARLVLGAWDNFERDGTFRTMSAGAGLEAVA